MKAVLPVSPFGLPIPIQAWDEFQRETGIAVVIDAAASFDSLVIGKIPSVVSLHTTKALGVGEGGFAISSDTDLIKQIRERSNFGFQGTREALVSAMNGKMSEYHAAIGLVGLNNWSSTRNLLMDVAANYRKSANHEIFSFLPGYGESWTSVNCILRVVATNTDQLAIQLKKKKIETRKWWGKGLHSQAAFKNFPSTPLTMTNLLAEEILGLPCFVDLEDETIRYICNNMLKAIII